MKLSGNTILITGGTSGIGFELAHQLLELGNTVIVTGRDRSHLDAAQKQLPGIHGLESDVSDPESIVGLYQTIVDQFADLNVLINNAGIMRKINLRSPGSDRDDITSEIEINLNGAIRMTAQFIPHLMAKDRAAIVNVTSGLAFVPLPIAPIYCATKAAMHSFTQSLRVQLKNTNVTVFEVAPPITGTPLFKGDLRAADVSGVKPMDVKTLTRRVVTGIEKDRLEIRPGLSNLLKLMSRIAPNFILDRLSKSADSISL